MDIIEKTIAFVKTELEGAESGHDWFHIERVWKNTLYIASHESLNREIAELGALLHDIADPKFHGGDEEIGPTKARVFLESIGCSSVTIDEVDFIIRHISFKGGHVSTERRTPELDAVQDADRLDAIGAIGIARAFNYGGYKNRLIYDPSILPDLKMSKESYRNSNAPTINHFYEKLLTLKNLMNTATGKKMAEERHQFMETFLNQFYSEWNGLK